MNTIVLKVEGGIVDPVSIPKDTVVVIRDYDVGDTSDDLLITDDDGNKYIEFIYDQEDSK